MYYCCWGVWFYILITLSWHLQDCYQDLDKIEPRLIYVSCTKKHTRYLYGLAKIFLRTKKQWKNYVRKKLAWFIFLSCKNLLESYQNHEYTLHDSCFIFVQESYKFHDKNLANILQRFLPRLWQGLVLGWLYECLMRLSIVITLYIYACTSTPSM